MRITGEVVRRVGDWAQEATGGAFVFQSFGPAGPGEPVRFIDGLTPTRGWKGPGAARQAAAYYGHGAARFLELAGGEVPGWVTEVLAEVDRDRSRKVAAAATDGREDARRQWDGRRDRGER
jgi:hypothetical protein